MAKSNMLRALSTLYLSILTILLVKTLCSYLPKFLVTRLYIGLEFLYLYVLGVWVTCSGTSNPIQLPLSLYINHVKTIFKKTNEKGYNMPNESRIVMFFTYLTIPVFLPMWTMFWYIDEFFFGEYLNNVNLSGSVFLVGGYRTGSTTCHRLLALDKNRFVSPKFVELFMPFLWMHVAADKFAAVAPQSVTDAIVKVLESIFANIMGEEVLSMHPMSMDSAEEDDVLLATWHKAGYYAGILYPDPTAWIEHGHFSDLSRHEQQREVAFYTRTMQKILYRRGTPNSVLLTKTHLIEFMPLLEQAIPNARFLGLFRHPKSSFSSWYSLAQATLRKRAASDITPLSIAVDAHCKFHDNFCKAELTFFKDATHAVTKDNNDDSTTTTTSQKFALTFNEFINDPIQMVYNIYECYNLDVSQTLAKQLDDELPKLKNYSKKKTWKNPTLDELGISEKIINERYKNYITTFDLK